MKRTNVTALTAAILVNLVFFVVIGCAWYHSKHHLIKHKTKAPTPPSVATSIVSPKGKSLALGAMDTVVSNTFHGLVHIQKTFVGPGNLDGLVLALKDSPAEKFIAYFDPNQKLLYLGQVINARGQNTTLKATQTYLSDPQKPKIIAAFAGLPAVITGSAQPKHVITILIDPNSPYFRTLYQNFLLDMQQQGLQIRWILVNYLKPMGPNLAAWILLANNPSKRLMLVASVPLSHWMRLKVPALNQKIVNTLRQHWDLMQSHHLVPGPVTLFKTSDHAYVIKGLVGPESFDQILPDINLNSD
jgi:hypothetical protein